MRKIKILFVCHGNICRSPMAEFILRHKVASLGLSAQFDIASAATSSEEIYRGVGNPVYPPARAELLRHGIDPTGKRARQITKDDYLQYDYLIAMEEYNVRNILRIIGSDPECKIVKLLEFTDTPGDIDDPWYTGDFALTYREIDKGCDGFLEYLRQCEKI